MLALPRYTPPSQNDDLAGSIIGGHSANVLRADFGATIAGGGRQQLPNKATANWGTAGGGAENEVRGKRGTVGGGWKNEADGDRSTVAGGWQNGATADDATVAGGSLNTAEGANATIPGGKRNRATGQYSFAAGRKADASADGTFVWADSTDDTLTARTADEFLAQSTGGVTFYTSGDLSTGVQVGAGEGTWSSVSARAAKRNVQSADTDAVLDAVEAMDVHRWEYDSASEATHMGPMAGEFHDAFGLGRDAKHIDSADADGVALAAIQGLSDRVERKEERIEELESTVERLAEQVGDDPDGDSNGDPSGGRA